MYNQTPSPFYDPNEAPDSKHQKVNAIWKVCIVIYALTAMGLSLYWEFTDQGLNLIFRELQLLIFKDGYYGSLNILLTLIALLIPVFIVKLIVEKITGVKIERGKV